MDGQVGVMQGWTLLLFLLLAVCRAQVVDEGDTTLEYPRRNPEIRFMHVRSDIVSRFATTRVTSFLANTASEAKEAVFSVRLPRAAFISNFSMELDGKVYVGQVKEKLAAKRQYEKAKSQGKSAGHVSQKARDTHAFKVAVNVAGQSKITFNLTYQELLQRRLGVYEHVININPGQVIMDLQVEIHIRESREITLLKVPPLRRDVNDLIQSGSENPLASIRRMSSTHAVVAFSPSVREQVEISAEGIAGQFVVNYDVKRNLDGGELQVVDGYFVHYFAPSGLQPVPKNVFFVIDVSGSMSGVKLSQTKDAMETILRDLRPEDRFNIIKFSSSVSFWRAHAVPAVHAEKEAAISYVRRMNAGGGTNINDALIRGLEYLIRKLEANASADARPRTSMIIFLTDGQPSSGVTNLDRIQSNVRDLNEGRVTLFSLGFGRGVDFSFLQKLSLQNRGLARRIYEDSDATLQLEGFYSEVSTPVLTNVNIEYLPGAVDPDSVMETDFNAFFQGSEIVVAGKLRSNAIPTLSSTISASSAQGDLELDLQVPARITQDDRSRMSNFTERLWAYLTIRKLLDQLVESPDEAVRLAAKQRALELSLKYSFVTPLTSMIVVKPDDPKKNAGDDEDDDDDDEKPTVPGKPGRNVNPKRHHPATRKPFVDNDPHFIVMLGGLDQGVCFDVMGAPGDIYQLVHDQISGVTVNGQIVGKDESVGVNGHPKTWFGKLAVMCGPAAEVVISPSKIRVSRQPALHWKTNSTVTRGPLTVTVLARRSVAVSCGPGLDFTVLRHKVHKQHPTKVDFLGFYIHDGTALSRRTHGLIGQFQHQTVVEPPQPLSHTHNVHEYKFHIRGPHARAAPVVARRGRRKNMSLGEHVPCWYVRNNGDGLLAGKHKDYVVPRLNFRSTSLRHKILTGKLPIYSHNLPQINKRVDPRSYAHTEDMFLS